MYKKKAIHEGGVVHEIGTQGLLNARVKHVEIRVQDRHRIKDRNKIYFIDAYSLFVNSDLYLSRICFLSLFLNMARELQFLIDLFRVFQIIGP